MSDLQLLVAHLVKLAIVAAIAGMLVRSRIGLCWSFALYLLVILVGNSLVTLVPHRFFTHSFWMVKQVAYDVLKVAVAIELAWRTFRAFPAAWRTARAVLLTLIAGSSLWLAWLTPHSYSSLWDWQPSAVTASVWLFTATALLVVRYQVPIGDWPRSIILGFALYLLFSVSLIGILRRHGWGVRYEVDLLDALAYLALTTFWAWAAWRPAERRERVRSELGPA